MRYDCLIVDVLNVAHRYFDHKKETPSYVSKKQVYKKAVCNFIEKIEQIEKDLLHSTGHVYMLIDNPTSRLDLHSSFYYPNRKEAFTEYKKNRAKQPKEFYNSINLLKYYYMVLDERYHTAQINHLEADDLVEPVLKLYCKNKKTLMMTNDLDWARFLSDDVNWMPDGNNPETKEDLAYKLGFEVSNKNIVAYKVLFGDPADNIPPLVSSKYKGLFPPFTEELKSDTDILFKHNEDKMLLKYPFLEHVKKNPTQLRINHQLVNSIPVDDKHIKNVLTTGRNSIPSQKVVRRSIGLDEENQKSFVFGNIRRTET